MFEGGLEVFDYFFGQEVGVGEVGGVFEAFVAEPEDVEAGFVPLDEFFVVEGFEAPGFLAFVAVGGVVALDEVFEVGVG